jgi:diguanylate cyclase (GGDEF)-like protein
MSPKRRKYIQKIAIINNIMKTVSMEILSAIRTIPLGIVLIAIIIFYRIEELPASIFSAMPAMSYAALIFGMAITFSFNHSRAFFILLILFLSQIGMTTVTSFYITPTFVLKSLYSLISLLLPLNILFFSSLTERGILSGWGRKHCFLIVLQVVFVMGLTLLRDRELIYIINEKFLDFSFIPQTSIPDLAVILFFITGTLLLMRRRRANAHLKTAILGVLVSVGFAHHFHSNPIAIPLFYAVAGLIIILSVIQDYYFKAYMDELTGLPSRRSLNEEMMRLDGAYVIAMLDVDFFKKFNDTYGHDAGDDVLRFIASVMRKFKEGKAFRYGGEEFTIVIHGKRLDDVITCLEELREKIAECTLVRRGGPKGILRHLNVTVSIGVAESNIRTIHPEEVIKVADTALYAAKNNGRNCVFKIATKHNLAYYHSQNQVVYNSGWLFSWLKKMRQQVMQ